MEIFHCENRKAMLKYACSIGGVMDYILIIFSVIMFGGCFALKDVYRAERGSSLKISLEFSLLGAIAGAVVLFAINGFAVTFTPFALLMAALTAVNGILFTFASFRALGKINLSLYSVFSMLGGMLLPFLQGIMFYGEEFTVAKAISLALIFAALLFTLEKDLKRRSGGIYYLLVFILNGMSGVISKLFASAPPEWNTDPSGALVSSAGYSVLASLSTIVLSGILLLTVGKRLGASPRHTPRSIAVTLASGSLNKIANWILVFALASGIDSSVQYPMVTGGTMIVSTAICFFGKNRPSKRELLSVLLAFLGMLALFLIPMLF